MKALTPRDQIEGLGAGVFIRRRNVESRLSEEDFHRAFSEPSVVWVAPSEYREASLDALLDAVAKLHAVEVFRFPNACVPVRILDRIRREFPKTRIEGVRKKPEPNQAPHPTTL